MLLACFLLLLGGLGRRFLCGLLMGLAALMVKMHALHFLPVAALFLWLERREDRSGGFLRSILAVAAGVVVAGLVWYLAVYRVNPSVVVKYFKSNIFVAQRGEYTNATLFDILTRRIGALVHLGSGRDGLFVKVPVLYALGAAGSLSVLSGFGNGKRETKPWERLIGRGISSGVSSQAKPIIIPWSPAPSLSKASSSLSNPLSRTSLERETAASISLDCS